MGTTLSSLQEQFAHDLHFLLKRNGHTTMYTEVEDLVYTIGDLCPWIPEEGTINPKEWSKISSCFHGQPRVHADVVSTCYKVQTCLQGARNILFDPEFETNLLSLPQILPPLPLMLVPSAAPLLDSKSHSDQPENTSWKSQDDLNALLPQAIEMENCLSMDATDACSKTDCVIPAASVMQESAIAVPVTYELFQAEGISELQGSGKDNEMDSLSAPWLVLNDCKTLIRDFLLPTEGFICLTKQAEMNPIAQATLLMFMEGAAFTTAVQQGFMATALTQTSKVAVNTWRQTLQSANQAACLPPSLADIPVNWDPGKWDPGIWDYEPPPDPGK